MVFIDENKTELIVPRHTKEYGETDRVFVIYLSAPSFPRKLFLSGENISNNAYFWKFNIQNCNYPENIGEYTYELVDSQTNNIIETGLLVYGDYVREEVKSINNKQKNVQLKYGK